MRKKPKKSYQPPVAAPVAEPSTQKAAPPVRRVKRVREVELSPKELARAAKKATRARWMLANP